MTSTYRLPERMTDRWRTRPDPPPGDEILYWHVLLGNTPAARAVVGSAQSQLSGLPGLHLTPLDRLHLTVARLGPIDLVDLERRRDMIESVQAVARRLPRPEITLGTVAYHPEAVVLLGCPRRAILPLRDAIRSAAGASDAVDTWLPHVTVAYSTLDQPARPLIEALGHRLVPRTVSIASVSLVAQRGPEREWNWQVLESVPLAERDPNRPM